jgi:RHS repeat-associated protein
LLDTHWNLKSSTGSISNPFQYAGQYTDTESGLQYLRARYYDPNTQQFLTVDPLVDETGQPYGYAADNPMNVVDPSGLCGTNRRPSPPGPLRCTADPGAEGFSDLFEGSWYLTHYGARQVTPNQNVATITVIVAFLRFDPLRMRWTTVYSGKCSYGLLRAGEMRDCMKAVPATLLRPGIYRVNATVRCTSTDETKPTFVKRYPHNFTIPSP